MATLTLTLTLTLILTLTLTRTLTLTLTLTVTLTLTKELHAAVGEPRWKLPPTTLAAVKKAMSLLVAMQRAGMPPPTASAPS